MVAIIQNFEMCFKMKLVILVEWAMVLALIAHYCNCQDVESVATNNSLSVFKSGLGNSLKYCSERTETTFVQFVYLITSKNDLRELPGKCYCFCMFRRYRVMDAEGNFNITQLRAILEMIPQGNFKTQVQSSMSNCILKSEDQDPCMKACQFFRCLRTAGGNEKPPLDDFEEADI